MTDTTTKTLLETVRSDLTRGRLNHALSGVLTLLEQITERLDTAVAVPEPGQRQILMETGDPVADTPEADATVTEEAPVATGKQMLTEEAPKPKKKRAAGTKSGDIAAAPGNITL
jgi:hypothetical protein